MSFTPASKDIMLDALVINTMSLHSGFPGTTGANEISGGSPAYARKAVTINASSGGVRAMSTLANFDVPASTVRWVGLWNSGTFRAYSPSGGDPKKFQVVTASSLISLPAHGYAANAPVVFYGDTVPSGLTAGTVYYVRDVLTDSFKVSATAGGTAITLSSLGGVGCLVSAITEIVYAAQGTHTIGSGSLELPF